MELFPTFFGGAESGSRHDSKPPRKRAPHSGPIFDDLPYWRPKGAPRHHIYQQYFTSAERRRLKALPENDVVSELQLLRVLLARSFSMVPRFPHDSKIAPLPIKLHIKLVKTFSRVALTIGSMVGLHQKMHKNDLGDLILESLRELDPYKEL
jgi:hypothetical protein